MKINDTTMIFNAIDHIGINQNNHIDKNNYLIKKNKLLSLDQKYGQQCHYWTEYFKVLVEKKIL